MDYFYNYLLQTFENNYGYEWDGKEPIEIDHILPISKAQTENEVYIYNKYTNMQLLKAKDNRKKHNKIDWKL